MAEVPLENSASVAPSETMPDDYIHVNTNPDMFGGGIAKAGEQLGQGISQAAKFYGQSAADQGFNNSQDQINKILHGDPTAVGPDGKVGTDTGYLGLEGQAALDKRAQVSEQIQGIINSNRPSGSPEAQLQYDNYSRRYVAQVNGQVGEYADKQSKTWSEKVNTDSAALAANGIAQDINDPEKVLHHTADLVNSYIKNAELSGAKKGDPVWTSAMQAGQQQALAVQIATIGVTDPAKAMKILDSNKAIAGDKYEAFSRGLKERSEDQQAVGVASQSVTQANTDVHAQITGGGERNTLLTNVAHGESGGGPKGDYDYDSIYGDGHYGKTPLPVTQMTINDLVNWSRHTRDSHGLDAAPVGRYQFITSTLQAMRDKLGLTGNELFTPQMQDRFAWARLEETHGNPALIRSAWTSWKGKSDAQIKELWDAGHLQHQQFLANGGRNDETIMGPTGGPAAPTAHPQQFGLPTRAEDLQHPDPFMAPPTPYSAAGFVQAPPDPSAPAPNAIPTGQQPVQPGAPGASPTGGPTAAGAGAEAAAAAAGAASGFGATGGYGTGGNSPVAGAGAAAAGDVAGPIGGPEHYKAVKANAYNKILGQMQRGEISPEVGQKALRIANESVQAQQLQEQEDAKQKSDDNDKAADEYTTSALTGKAGPNIMQQIAQDPRLDWKTKHALSAAVMAEMTNGNDSAASSITYGPGYLQAYKGILAKPGDPNRIANPADLYNMAVPDAQGNQQLNMKGVQQLLGVMKEIKTTEGYGTQIAKSDLESYAKTQISTQEDTAAFPGAPIRKDPEGEKAFLSVFVPKFEAAYTDWTVNQGKSPFEFLTKENVDKFIANTPGLPTKQQRDENLRQQTAMSAAQLTPPPTVNPHVWSVLTAPAQTPVSAETGKPFDPHVWSQALRALSLNPTKQNMDAFDASAFGQAGWRAGALLDAMHPARSKDDAYTAPEDDRTKDPGLSIPGQLFGGVGEPGAAPPHDATLMEQAGRHPAPPLLGRRDGWTPPVTGGFRTEPEPARPAVGHPHSAAHPGGLSEDMKRRLDQNDLVGAGTE